MPSAADIEQKAIDAAMTIAAERPWDSITLRDIAAAAGLSLAQLYPVLWSKPAILDAYMRQVDVDMLTTLEEFDGQESSRDRLFDVIMQRLDTLERHRAGVRSVFRALSSNLTMLPALHDPMLRSMGVILAGAALDSSGFRGGFRRRLMGIVWLTTLRVWLEDDMSDLAKTMAHLDRQLRRIEEISQGFCGRVNGRAFPSAARI